MLAGGLPRAHGVSCAKRLHHLAEKFADDLHSLALEESNWDEMRDLGGIDLLVAILKLGPCRAATQSAAALTHLAHSSPNRDAIRDAQGIQFLVTLLSEPPEGTPAIRVQQQARDRVDWVETATNAAAALRNLTHNNNSNQDAIREAGGVPPLIRLLAQGAASNAASRAADALGGLARNTHRQNQIAIRDAGGIEQLVALLTEEPIGEAATKAAGALKHLAFAYSANREAIRAAGGILPLVALLELRRENEEDVMIIAGALWNLSYNNQPNQDAIREAGGVRLLVQLLKAGATWKAMPNVVGAIRNLCQNSPQNKDAVREAGGIGGLVELLQAGHESPAAMKAAETLEVLLEANAANERATIAAIRDHADGNELLTHFSNLLERLQKAAERVLMTAVERNDAGNFDRAWSEAVSLKVDEKVMEAARQRAAAVRDQAEREEARRVRRESLGLGALPTPNEFLCPITQDVMIDPVVASDGHSYERAAIQSILDRGALDGGASLSPLTREELEPSLIPNINLRKRIREHDLEVESVAEQVLSSIGHRPGGIAAAGGSSSKAPLSALAPFEAAEQPANVEDAPPSAGAITPVGDSSSGAITPIDGAAMRSLSRGGGGAAGAAGSSSVAGPAAAGPFHPDPAAVASNLAALGLQRYKALFDQHGYDCWPELVQMAGDSLDKLAATVGMASNHYDRLRTALARQREGGAGAGEMSAHGQADVVPDGGGGGSSDVVVVEQFVTHESGDAATAASAIVEPAARGGRQTRKREASAGVSPPDQAEQRATKSRRTKGPPTLS